MGEAELKKGYEQMAEINIALAESGLVADSEALTIYEKYLGAE